MCYAIPGKVVGIQGNIVSLDYFGEEKKAFNIEGFALAPEDYAYAQAGIIVQKIDSAEAKKILLEWKNEFFRLKQKDESLSTTAPRKTGDKIFDAIIQNALEGIAPEKKDIQYLLQVREPHKTRALFEAANFLRQKTLKNACCVHGIIEYSNSCKKNCEYCGIHTQNPHIARYTMAPKQLVENADFAVNQLGFKALVLQSGEGAYSIETLCQTLHEIKKLCGTAIFISAGDFSRQEFEELKKAGAQGTLLRFETSNEKLHQKFRGYPLKKRLESIQNAIDARLLVSTGSLIGLPGQTMEDLANDLMLAKSLNAEMLSFGPLIAHPNTPLANAPSPSLELCLKFLAATRLAVPDAKILATTALETLSPNGLALEQALKSGANTLMINATFPQFQEKYDLYPGKISTCPVQQQISQTISLLKKLGRAPTDLGI